MESVESLPDPFDDGGFDLNERLLQADEAFLNDDGDVPSGSGDVIDANAEI